MVHCRHACPASFPFHFSIAFPKNYYSLNASYLRFESLPPTNKCAIPSLSINMLNAKPVEIVIDLPHQDGDSKLASFSQTRRPSNPRRSRCSDRRSTMGSLSSYSTGGSAISVESSDDAFASALMALVDQTKVDMVPTFQPKNAAGMLLDRQISNLTIDDGSTSHSEPLIIRKVQSQLLDKHIRAGRISSVATSIDLRGGRSRDQLSNAAAGKRRIHTTLSFGTNIGRLAYESQGSSMPRAMSRNGTWNLEGRAGTANKSNTNKAAVSAGRALLGR